MKFQPAHFKFVVLKYSYLSRNYFFIWLIMAIKMSSQLRDHYFQRLSYTRSVQKIHGLFELRDSSWFQENPLGVASVLQIN